MIKIVSIKGGSIKYLETFSGFLPDGKPIKLESVFWGFRVTVVEPGLHISVGEVFTSLWFGLQLADGLLALPASEYDLGRGGDSPIASHLNPY